MLSLVGTADVDMPVVLSEVEGSIADTLVNTQNKSNETGEITIVQADPCMHDKSLQVISRNRAAASNSRSRSSSGSFRVIKNTQFRPPVTPRRRSSPVPIAKSPRVYDELKAKQLKALNSFCIGVEVPEGDDQQRQS